MLQARRGLAKLQTNRAWGNASANRTTKANKGRKFKLARGTLLRRLAAPIRAAQPGEIREKSRISLEIYRQTGPHYPRVYVPPPLRGDPAFNIPASV